MDYQHHDPEFYPARRNRYHAMKPLHKILSWLVTLLLPLALTFLGVHLLLTHAFPAIEYRLPGFPVDEYGFTLQDRLHWSQLSIDYLLNNADISFLGDLTFPDGTPLFNARELSHMYLSLIHISEPTRLGMISYAVFCLKK